MDSQKHKPGSPAADGLKGLKEIVHSQLRRARSLVTREIWELEHLGSKSIRARVYALLRILTLTWQGLRRNRIPVQAAALTFYSLIGLGPLIAIGIMVSGFVIDRGDENLAIAAISKAIAFAAPQTALSIDKKSADAAENGATGLGPEITDLLNNFVEAAQSGTVGVVGSLMLLVIGIQVLSSIEGSFNSLWGVAKGRRLGERIIAYWTFITLGAVLGAAALTLLTLKTISTFFEKLPFGGQFFDLMVFFSPVIAFIMIALILTTFFRFIPNTRVEWKAAFVGAIVVVILLHLYNFLSFIYVQRVIDTRSLYGSVGFLVILMIGLYIFWLLILLGGQITYAVQNADYLTSENAWQNVSYRTREIVSLAVLLLIGKRFRDGREPLTESKLHQRLRIPNHILNTSIHKLCELGFIRPILGEDEESERDPAYQPGRPLDAIALGAFKQAFETLGNNEGADLVEDVHPGIRYYLDGIISLKHADAAGSTIEDLISGKTA